jgi:hypothetical protein
MKQVQEHPCFSFTLVVASFVFVVVIVALVVVVVAVGMIRKWSQVYKMQDTQVPRMWLVQCHTHKHMTSIAIIGILIRMLILICVFCR